MISKSDLIELYLAAQADSFKWSAEEVLIQLVKKSLSRNESLVYDAILTFGSVTNGNIQRLFGWKCNQAGNVLLRLHRLGLLARSREDADYMWRLKPVFRKWERGKS